MFDRPLPPTCAVAVRSCEREQEYTGTLMELCQSRRGVLMDMKFASKARGSIIYEIPLAEVWCRLGFEFCV